jgi:glucose-1-phosphate cytidylyltransferase
MKVVILAGGYGTRLAEATDLIPKPMVEIGGRPILWHIMKIYSQFGFNDFVILLGYKGYLIKEYFANYYLHQNDIRFDFTSNTTELLSNGSEPWKVTLLDTGADTMTGGRIKRAQARIGDEPFLLSYGDGVANVDLRKLVDFHRQQKTVATLTAIQPEARFGNLNIGNSGHIRDFSEKPKTESGWINGGFFVMEPAIFNYLQGDDCILEQGPLQTLVKENSLSAFHHHGFWQCMDTLRDNKKLNQIWNEGKAPWKTWD